MRKIPIIFFSILFFVGLSLLNYWYIKSLLLSDKKIEIDHLSTLTTRKVLALDTIAYSLQSFFQSAFTVDADQFRIFSEQILEKYPFLVSIRYYQKIYNEDIEDTIDEMRSSGYASFAIHNSYYDFKSRKIEFVEKEGLLDLQQEYIAALLYTQPFSGKSLGYNIMANTYFLDVIRTVIGNNLAYPSSSFQSVDNKKIFSYFLPTYEGKDIPESYEDRQEYFNGLISIQVDQNELFREITEKGQSSVELSWKSSPSLTKIIGIDNQDSNSNILSLQLSEHYPLETDKIIAKLRFNKIVHLREGNLILFAAIELILAIVIVLLNIVYHNWLITKKEAKSLKLLIEHGKSVASKSSYSELLSDLKYYFTEAFGFNSVNLFIKGRGFGINDCKHDEFYATDDNSVPIKSTARLEEDFKGKILTHFIPIKDPDTEEIISFLELETNQKILDEAEKLDLLSINIMSSINTCRLKKLLEVVRMVNSKMSTLLDNIYHGIILINQDLKIDTQYSSAALHLLAEPEIAGRDIRDVLTSKLIMSEEEKDQLDAVIENFMNENMINWQLNEGWVPQRCELKLNGIEKRQYSFDWIPLTNNEEIIEKIMVIIEDVTEKEQLRKKLSDKQDINDIIIEITNLNKGKARKYFASIADLTNSLVEIVEQESEKKHNDSILRFFRITHTIKGNARTFGFNLLSRAIHSLESANKINDDLTIEKLSNTDEWSFYLRKFEDYKDVFKRIFGDNVDSTEAMLSSEEIDQLIKICSILPQDNKDVYDRSQKLLEGLLEKVYPSTRAIRDYTSTIISQTAKELGYQQPRLNFTASVEMYFKEPDFLAITSFLGHMIRNSVDHGIGNKEEGLINMEIEYTHQGIEIILSDSGQGLNIDGIRKKISSSGVDVEEKTDKEISLTIFESGFSTKEQLSNISGKGVGMDAVAHSIKELGGYIDLDFVGDKNDGKRRFRFIVKLPKSLIFYKKEKGVHWALKTGS